MKLKSERRPGRQRGLNTSSTCKKNWPSYLTRVVTRRRTTRDDSGRLCRTGIRHRSARGLQHPGGPEKQSLLPAQAGRAVAQADRGTIQAARTTGVLDDAEKEAVRTVLNSERFQFRTLREVYATLQNEGVRLCHGEPCIESWTSTKWSVSDATSFANLPTLDRNC